jgi:hemerythrin-like domain-containing protein
MRAEKGERNMDVGTTVKHPMVDFIHAVDQLRNEHEGLRATLIRMEETWHKIITQPTMSQKVADIQALAQRVEAYLNVLHAHAIWEDEVLFPMVSMYFQANAEQVHQIEADHAQAETDLRTFITIARAADAQMQEGQVQTVGMKLLHACRLLTNHFNVEEQIVFPLAEEILEDIDYMSL